ncbi:MAG: GDSL-type esterase/lipase family protein [Candidatus Eisenbacteria bacterium]
MKQILKNITLSLVVLIIIFAIFEIAFRLIAGSPIQTRGQHIAERREGDMKYALEANIDREYAGARVVTNSLGLRDFRPPHKSDGTEQILILGDSFTFGYGVALEQSYPGALEQLLNEASTTSEYEVINAGVPGYDTVDELELLKTIIEHYSPKWIVVGLHPGDFLSREEVEKRPMIRLREALRYNSAFFAWFMRFYKTQLIKYVPPPKSMLSVDPGKVLNSPAATRNKEALKEIRAIAEASGAETAVFMIAPLISWQRYPYKSMHTGLAEFCEANQIHFVDPLDDLSKHEPADLWVGPNDSHYNPQANRIAAEVLRRFLKSM